MLRRIRDIEAVYDHLRLDHEPAQRVIDGVAHVFVQKLTPGKRALTKVAHQPGLLTSKLYVSSQTIRLCILFTVPSPVTLLALHKLTVDLLVSFYID